MFEEDDQNRLADKNSIQEKVKMFFDEHDKPVIAKYNSRIIFVSFLFASIPLLLFSAWEMLILNEDPKNWFMKMPMLMILVLSFVCLMILLFVSFRQMRVPAIVISKDYIIIKKGLFLSEVTIGWNQVLGLKEEIMKVSSRYGFSENVFEILKIVFKRFEAVSEEIVVDQVTLHQYFLSDSEQAFSLLKRIIPPGISLEKYRRIEKLRNQPFHTFRYRHIELDKYEMTVYSDSPEKNEVIKWENITRFKVDTSDLIMRDTAVLIIMYKKDDAIKEFIIEDRISGELKTLVKMAMTRLKKDAIDESLLLFLDSLGPRRVYAILIGFSLIIFAVVYFYVTQ